MLQYLSEEQDFASYILKLKQLLMHTTYRLCRFGLDCRSIDNCQHSLECHHCHHLHHIRHLRKQKNGVNQNTLEHSNSSSNQRFGSFTSMNRQICGGKKIHKNIGKKGKLLPDTMYDPWGHSCSVKERMGRKGKHVKKKV